MASIHRSKAFICYVASLTVLFVLPSLMESGNSFRVVAAEALSLVPALLNQIRPADHNKPDDSDSSGVLSGKVLDDLGEPVVGATMSLISTVPKRTTIAETRTDGDGKYNFDVDLVKGEYSLSIRSVRCVGITTISDQPRMVLSPNLSTVRDFRLQRCCVIKVRVVDENGDAVQNAQVRSILLDEERPADFSVTNTKGNEWIDVYCPKSANSKCLICAFHDEFAMESITQTVDDVEAVPRRTIFLKRGKTISGRVICADGKPARGWQLDILPTSWSYSFTPNGPTIADDGTFKVNNIGAGKYDISIRVPKGGSTFQKQQLVAESDLSELKEPLRLRLDYPSPESLVSITGMAKFDGAPPPNGFGLSAKSVDGKYSFSVWVAAGTDHFRFGDLPPGEYNLSCQGSALQEADLKGVLAPSDNLTFNLKSRNKVRLRGTVLDEATMQPLPRFLIRVTRPGWSGVYDDWVHVVDDQGRFDMGVENDGEYRVLALAFGYGATASELINTAKSRDQELTIKVKPEVPLTGIVVDESGTPITDAMVIPLEFQPTHRSSSTAPPEVPFGADDTQDGHFTLLNLAEGKHSLRVTHPSFCSIDLTNVELRREASEPLRITLPTGARIKGIVFDDKGLPRREVPLVATPGDTVQLGSTKPSEYLAVTDKNGEYVIDHLPTGYVCLRLRSENLRRGVVRRSILVENKGNYPFNLGGNNRLSGRLIMNGHPYAQQKLVLTDNSPLFGRMCTIVHTDEEGDFEVWGVPPGRWMLSHRLAGKEFNWGRLREVEIPAVGDVDLGEINHATGSVTVQCDPALVDRLKDYRLTLRIPHSVSSTIERSMEWQGTDVPNPIRYDEVPLGDYELWCTPLKLISTTSRARVSVTSTIPNPVLNLRLPIGTAQLSGRIEPAAVAKLNSQRLSLRSDDDQFSVSINADKDGSFKLDNLPAATYVVRAGFFPDAPVVDTIKLEDEKQKSWDVTAEMIPADMSTTGYFRVKTLIREGIPTPINVTLKNRNQILESTRGTQIESSFVGPAGVYELTATLPGFRTFTREIEIVPWTPAVSTSPLIIQLEPKID